MCSVCMLIWSARSLNAKNQSNKESSFESFLHYSCSALRDRQFVETAQYRFVCIRKNVYASS